MRVTVQVPHAVAQALHNRAPANPSSDQILDLTKNLGVSLKPMHPGTDDPNLATFFALDVPDRQTAETVTQRLRQCEGCSAYIKPLDAMP